MWLFAGTPGPAAGGQPVQPAPWMGPLRQAAAPGPAAEDPLRRPAAAHYAVVALRVEFQPDTTRFTTGDGTFAGDLFGGLAPQVDPLPHDAAYFEAHLAFLEDYVARASGGRTAVSTYLLPEVVRVSKPMGAYSPVGPEADSDAELAKQAALVAEAWHLAGEQSAFDMTRFDPERTAFVLFHAGVGYDLALTSTTLDRTPEDLPSLFFGEQVLRRLLGDEPLTFNGFPVDHTIILPRTETRRGFNFVTREPFLLELSINGLMAASFFNFLGVPDLFNTATGESAVGPFGLMDPLGFFAYGGLFPPLPCAWTRYYLGWADPVELRGAGPEEVRLQAAGLGQGTSVARAWISGAEYFLAENRHRDVAGDGLVLRIWKEGQVVEQRVPHGDETFNAFTQEGFAGGVVVGVDDYDWALPGGLDEDGNVLSGGILIWHVDERRIGAGLADNTVNADPQRRGVHLEEADGAPDIGFPTQGPFGPRGGDGSPFDFFYEGNPVVVRTELGREIRLYQNRFGPDTYPSSHANEGGPSFVVLENFTGPGAEMGFTYRLEGAAGIMPLEAYAAVQLEGPFGPGGAVSTAQDALFVFAGGASPDGAPLVMLRRSDGASRQTFAHVTAKPVVYGPALAAAYQAQAEDPARPFFFIEAGERTQSVPVPEQVRGRAPAAPLVFVPPAAYTVFAGDPQQLAVRYREGGDPEVDVRGLADDVVGLAAAGPGLAYVTRTAAFVAEGEAVTASWTYDLAGAAAVGQPVFGRDRSGLLGVVPCPDCGELLFLLADGTVRRLDVAAAAGRWERQHPAAQPAPAGAAALSAYPVLADLDGDERLDVLTTYGSVLIAFTQGGAVVSGFPISLNAPIVAQPLVAELTGSGTWSILAAATDGYLYAYDLGNRGEPVPGFPLAVGVSLQATPLLQDQTLYAVSEAGAVRAWQLEHLGPVWWGQLYGNAQNQSYVELPAGPEPTPPPDGLLDAAETYNWPNPVTEGTTHLRFKAFRDCRVQITVVDLAGGLIDRIEIDNVRGGVPVDHLWQPEAPSGIYVARIRAVAEDGTTETRLVKMAIIR